MFLSAVALRNLKAVGGMFHRHTNHVAIADYLSQYGSQPNYLFGRVAFDNGSLLCE